jgi:fused signal recognition particle receptor
MEIVLIIALLVVVGGVAATLVSRRRGPDRGDYLEPPAPKAPVDVAEPRPSDVEAALEPELPAPDDETVAEIDDALPPLVAEEEVRARPTFRDRLGRARGTISGYLGAIAGRSGITEETWDDLEEALIRADVGVRTTTNLVEQLRKEVADRGITGPDDLLAQLKADLKVIVGVGDPSLRLEPGVTNVWLFVGVNGAGKTTTIGKVGRQQVDQGRTVVMAAGDTFRAAAAEQLGTWAERCGAHLVRGNEGGDPSAVIFDGIQAAASRGADLVLADTAGRLQNKVNLMEELRKVRRVADRDPGTVTEVLLVIDATTGQNGLSQAQAFTEAVDVTGIVLTKLDSSAKGGIVLAIADELGIPIKLVGLGEQIEDLVPFDPDDFVEALFS